MRHTGAMNARHLLAPLLLLGACATTAANGAALQGTHWRFVSIDGARPVAPEARLEFPDGRISAWLGCNGLGGDLRIEGDKLKVGPMVSTMMWCEGVMDQERAVGELLGATPEFRIEKDGRLLLSGGGHKAELQPQR